MKTRPAARPLAAALALALAPVAPALAMQFEMSNDVKINLDTTITYGMSFRATERDHPLTQRLGANQDERKFEQKGAQGRLIPRPPGAGLHVHAVEGDDDRLRPALDEGQ